MSRYPNLRRLASWAVSVAVVITITACGSSASYPPAPEGYYRVTKGDTLYRIAVNNRRTVAELVRWNSIKDPASIEVGDLVRVVPPPGEAVVVATPVPTPTPPSPSPSPSSSSTTPKPSTSRPAASAPKPASSIPLIWPVQGKVVASYNGNRNKGIDISAPEGADVKAAAAGRVTYAGNGLRGYGNLLIVKHNEDFITVYAHNKTLLAKEGQTVTQGQRIATVGNTDSDSVKLHFEVRYRGEPVDPSRYLPQGD